MARPLLAYFTYGIVLGETAMKTLPADHDRPPSSEDAQDGMLRFSSPRKKLKTRPRPPFSDGRKWRLGNVTRALAGREKSCSSSQASMLRAGVEMRWNNFSSRPCWA